jgi:NAD dependent epimerase/dehydratase family enzyme
MLALTWRRASPKRVVDEGFTFEHRDLRSTLQALVA